MRNPNAVKAAKKRYCKKYPERRKKSCAKYREKHKAELKIKGRKYYNEHKENSKQYYESNKQEKILQSRAWGKKNPDKVRENARLLQKRRRLNPKHRLNDRMSVNIGIALKGNKAGRGWESLVGYTLEHLKKHLEELFIEGMTWDNMGQWHIDHEIPISAFNFTKSEHIDFKKCWALSNLQPMWAFDNYSKRDKLIKHFQPNLELSL